MTIASIDLSLLSFAFLGITIAAIAFLVIQTLRIESLKTRIQNLQNKRESFSSKGKFLNGTEEYVLKLLFQLYEDQFYIFSQTHLASIVKVSKNAKDYYNTLKELDYYLDFVLVDKQTMLPKVVIEFNGITHEKVNRKIRDKFLKDLLNSCGIGLVFLKSVDLKPDYIKLEIENELKKINEVPKI